ncbi:integrase [Bacillus sp. V3-13]|uniref:site-specific integrase n=1 Tax=Bacillus sp. V3-13 TaxID=2053728 RepID=UPI000C766313|nr:site-specific integrase [Bacillus sp. V3-13]PLR75243.1 integrase [Bacillus sp. V3-13]
MTPTDLSYHLSKYLSEFLPGTRGLSSNTIASRRDAFALLLGFCRDVKGIPVEKVKIQTLTTKLITDFLDWLEENRGCCAATRNQRLTSIKAFFKYLQSVAPEHILLCQQIMSMPLKKTTTGNIGYLTLDGIKVILDSVDSTTRSGRRDLVLLSVLYDSGARVQELADLTVGDIRLQKPGTISLTGKGRKKRIVPMMEPTAGLLKQYLAENNLDGAPQKQYPLFCNRSGEKLTRAGISYVLKKYVNHVRDLNLTLIPDVVSVHSFRHSKAMHMLQAGVPLIYIRDILGHEEISTTEIYARCDGKMKREAFESAYSEIHSSKLPVWKQDDNLMAWLKSLC